MTSMLYPGSHNLISFNSLWSILCKWLPLPETPPAPVVTNLPTPTPLDPAILHSLNTTLGTDKVNVNPETLCKHANGITYAEYLRQHTLYRTPGAIVYPESETDIAVLMSWSAERELQLLPWGGGYNPYYGKSPNDIPFIVVNMERLNKVMAVDQEYRQVRVQAGIQWKTLEDILASSNMSTEQVYPSTQATVGGSIATNAHNLKALGYGTLRKNIQTLRGVTPAGLLHLEHPQPQEIDKRSMLVGTYGAWAIITEAVLRLFPYPTETLYLTSGFETWEEAITLLWQILQQGIRPSWARITGNKQQELLQMEHPQPSRLGLWINRANVSTMQAYLTLGLEGEHTNLLNAKNRVQMLLKEARAHPLPARFTTNRTEAVWPQHPMPGQQLWQHGILVDIITASVPWPKVAAFQQEWEEALQSVLQATSNTPCQILTTLYAAEEYAILYTLLLGMQVTAIEEKLLQLEAIHSVAQETKRRWDISAPPSTNFQQVIEAISQTLDPTQVMLNYHWPHEV
ncbi:MAG: FAD-binding protein [Anaerolineae bacterium]|nr:FAD-binding protein [Anaerolineae bacterium]